MFLVTSADQRYWDKSQDILFLGEWCKEYSHKNDWENLNYSVLPYPWENTEIFNNDILYIEKLCNKILPILGSELNKIHKIDRSAKYWKLLLYPWVYFHIIFLYDRYLLIKSASESNLVTNTFVLQSTDLQKIIPFWNCMHLYGSDEYEQYIYGRIIEITNALPYTAVNFKPNWQYKRLNCVFIDPSSKGLLKKIIISINEKLATLISLKHNKIQIINPYMSYTDTLKLYIKLRQIPSIIHQIPVAFDDKTISLKQRNQIKDDLLQSLNDNEFERLFCALIPEILPKVYLENFDQISEDIQKYTKKTKIIYSAASYYEPGILFYTAEICDTNNGKFISTQYGGSSGSALFNHYENVLKEVSDIFLSWGWDDKSYQNIIAMPTVTRFSYVKDIGSNNNSGKILLIETDSMRATRGSGHLAPFSFPNYIDNQLIFYEHLSSEAKKLLNIRLFMVDHWDFHMQWKDKFPDADINSKGRSFYELLKECRLAINSVNDTTLLECLVGNIPTILFFNPKYDQIRPDAQPYYDLLNKVGVLHYTPESAAKLVNEIYGDPMKWWMQPEIQNAKDIFCYHFARTSDDALDQLTKFLKEEYNKISE